MPPPPKDEGDQPLTPESLPGIAEAMTRSLAASVEIKAGLSAVRVGQIHTNRQIETLAGHVGRLATEMHDVTKDVRQLKGDVRDLKEKAAEHHIRLTALEDGPALTPAHAITHYSPPLSSEPPPAPRGTLRDSGTFTQTPQERAESDYAIQRSYDAMAAKVSGLERAANDEALKKAEAERINKSLQARNDRLLKWIGAILGISVILWGVLAFVGPRIWGAPPSPTQSVIVAPPVSRP